MKRQFFQMALSILISLLLMTGSSNAQNSSKMTKENQVTTVELTSFNLVDGTDEAKFIATAKEMQASFLNKQEGFIKRTLVKGENGWTDVVYWKDPQSMQQAMQKAETSVEVVPFMQMIDFNSVRMNLSEIKLNDN